MQVKTTITYTTVDGKVFDDEDKAYAHENQYIFDHSGFDFFDADNHLISNVADVYDECSGFTIDRRPEFAAFNRMFVEDVAEYYYGWTLPDNILTDTSVKYVYDDDGMNWIRK